MAKTWVLDTETKGTGARMVPLESLTKRPSAAEPVLAPRQPVRPPEPEGPKPRAPHKFKIVDLMSRQMLADGASTREAVDVLGDVRSVVDVSVYSWDEERARWRLLTLPERRALWELAHRP
ncbi:MAG: hypothetical protein WAK93_08420 [Solirubrobacteraceae bacterium]